MVIYQEPLFIVWEWENDWSRGWTRRTDWSSSEILSLSLFTPPPYIFDSQKKPNDSQDKFYFLSCGCGGFEESRTKGGLITRTHTRKKHINILKCDFISAAADSPDLAAITYIAIIEIIYNKHDITNKYVTEWHPGINTADSIHQKRYLKSRSEHDTWYFYFFIIDNQHLNNKKSGISTFYSNNSKLVGFLVFKVFEQKELLVIF